MNYYKKAIRHFRRLQKHPMTSQKIYVGLLQYLYFNIKCRIVNEQEVNWLCDLKFYLRAGDAGLVGNLYYGLYEFEESLFLLHFMKKDDIFLDIGANLGHYSLLLSGIKKCKTIAIEPVPATYKQFVRNVALNGLQDLIEPIQMGIADREDALYFSTDKNTMDRIVKPNYKNAVKVPVTTIDLIVEEKPVAIKLDVEGYEYFALVGAEMMLKSTELKVIILELNQSGKKYGVEDDKIYNLLLDSGFMPFKYNFQNRKLIPLDSYNKDQFNTIFIKDVLFVQKRLLEAEKIKVWDREY